MSTASPTPHQREHEQQRQRDTRQIEPCDWADALNAQARTYTRLLYFCLGILAGALFCLGYLAGQNSHNSAHPSANPYPFAASTPATPGGPVAATLTPVVPTALNIAPAQAPTPATRASEPVRSPSSGPVAAALPAVSGPVRPGAGTLAFIGSSDASGRCDTPTGRDRDGRGSVVRAGPVTVSIAGIDLARLTSPDLAAERCDDRATTYPASSHDNNSGNDPGHNSGKDKNRKDNNGQQRDRNGWAWPSDPRDWPGWRGDGLPPYNYGSSYGPGYGPGYGSGYGPGYGPGWGPGSGFGYGPYGYNYPPNGYRGYGGDRGELGMCRVYQPGAHPDLPDGGLVCIRDNQPPR